ncbi:MAG TPA: VOC family protein [Actinomycetota bacterium]|nr:VOC family protein [Actinomycetota bacterium]
MEPRIDVITIAVADLDRALAFYRDGLGLETEGIIGTEFPGSDTEPAGAAVMFRLPRGLTFALYPRTELAKDANVAAPEPSTGGFSVGWFVATDQEVDEVLARAEAAGATLTDTAHRRPWDLYSGYFRDLDGHLWEVISHPDAR